MNFWDTELKPDEFDFLEEKNKLIANLDKISNMSVEESTLYKKWVELQEPSILKSKSNINELYDIQWKPTDIYNKELTISEIQNLDPYIEIVKDDDVSTKWSNIRRMIHSMSWTANPGRNIKLNVKDRVSGKLLGQVSLASDVTSLAVRDTYIGWTRDNRFKDGKLNNTSIASTIVSTQPFGYNFLGGKLIAMMATIPEVRQYWKDTYGDILIAIGTTSLYGIHSQYNGLPLYKTLGESSGRISIKPDNDFYDPWHQWLKQNRTVWYETEITEERKRNGANMYGTESTRSGPVSGIKQKIISKILSECNIKQSKYQHGFKRGVYLAMIYENGSSFLRNEIPESDLIIREKFDSGINYITNWWKPKAINRYIKLYDSGNIKPDHLWYGDAIGLSWEDTKEKYLKEIGR
jgi:hypothetical protein